MSINNGMACYGCRICETLCPVNAIKFKKNSRGFMYPEVDREACIECGICERNCGLVSETRVKNSPIEFYALKTKDKDIKKKSSSGGVFSLLAKEIFSQNGVVYGCLLDENQNAVYGRAEKWDECIPFMGSKYVQSDMGNIVEAVLEDLKKGRIVLFTGTPCECLGIKTAAANIKSTGVLVTCDFYCHGSPSPMIFDDFKKYMEEKHGGKIISFVFRDKEKVVKPPSSRGIRIKMLCGEQEKDIYDAKSNDKYYELFKFNYILRESCYECPCIGFDRDTDITLGDYWGCEKFHPEFFDREGISLVSVNTLLGADYFAKIKDKAECISIEREQIRQPMLNKPPQRKQNYDQVWETYYSKGFDEAATLCVNSNRLSMPIRLKIRILELIPVLWLAKLREIRKTVKKQKGM